LFPGPAELGAVNPDAIFYEHLKGEQTYIFE
jgi:hypothetical protein